MPNIIGGKYKRTKINIPNNLVRPTSALKREAIFSVIESFSIRNSIEIYKNKSIIDIFAGSGLIGLEAISRGMSMSYFIENDNSVAKILEENCKKICKNQEYKIILREAITALEQSFKIKPSIIFIDPPYKKENINLILIKILEKKIKIRNTIIIIETGRKEKVRIPKELTIFKEKNYGKTKLLFIN